MGDEDHCATSGKFGWLESEYHWAGRKIDPKNDAWQPTSRFRGPLPKKPVRRLAISFRKQKVQSAISGVSIHLLIPARLLARIEPLTDAPVFVRWQLIDRGLDLFYPVHILSLPPPLVPRGPRIYASVAAWFQ